MIPAQRIATLRRHFDKERFVFDRQAAYRAIKFASLRVIHTKGEWAGQPFVLQPWQYRIFRRLFGWKRRSDNTRKYRTLYLFLPRKNGKSFIAAAIGLYLLYADKEEGAEIISAAADKEQAAIVFDMARDMVKAEPLLQGQSKVYRRSIAVLKTRSIYKVISADAYTKHGQNLHGIICDELHAQPSRELVDVLITSVGSRRQPLTVFCTTAGYDRKSICWEYHQHALNVRNGTVDDPFFLPILYGANEKDDFKDPKVWARANPNLNISKKRDYMEEQANKAKSSPAYENTFKRLDLNVWTEQATRWIPMNEWDACAETVPDTELLGKPCFAGMDLSSREDMTAIVLLFQLDKKFIVRPHFFLPEERVKEGHFYADWKAQGFLHVTPGNIIDYGFIRNFFREQAKLYRFLEVAFDSWNATQISLDLEQDGFKMVTIRQGFSAMSAPCMELLSLILSKRLIHYGHPILRWNAANVTVEHDSVGNIRPSKPKSTAKIDGIVALVIAMARAILFKNQVSVYESRGVLRL